MPYQIWKCVWCLRDFATEEECEEHENYCRENPKNHTKIEWVYNLPTSKLVD